MSAVPLPIYLGSLFVVGIATDDRLLRALRAIGRRDDRRPTGRRSPSRRRARTLNKKGFTPNAEVLRRASHGADEVLRRSGVTPTDE
jgi:hypothetical protein